MSCLSQCKLIFSICIFLLLTGCSSYQKKNMADQMAGGPDRADYEHNHFLGKHVLVRKAWLKDKHQFKLLRASSHLDACSSLMELADFSEARNCLDLAAQQEAHDFPSSAFSSDSYLALIDSLEAHYYYLIGDYAKARFYADRSIENLQLENRGQSKLSSLFGGGGHDGYFWYGNIRSGYVGGMSQIALGEGAIDAKYYEAVNNPYLFEAREYHTKYYVSKKSAMLLAEKQYRSAVDLLTGAESSQSSIDRAGMFMVNVMTFGIAPLINKIEHGDASWTGGFTFAGSWLEHSQILAEAYMQLGEYDKAKALHDVMLDKLKDSGFSTLFWKSSYDRAVIAQYEGDAVLADHLFKQAIYTIEEQRSSLVTDGSKVSFVGDKQAVYQSYVAFLIKQGGYQQAFEYSDKAKARALVDMLASREINTTEDSPYSGQALYQKFRMLDENSALLAHVGTQEKNREHTRALKRVVEEIEMTDPQLHSLITAKTPSAKDIQAKLRSDESLIQFYKLSDRYHAFVVTKNLIVSQHLDFGSVEEVDALVSDFRKSILDVNSQNYQFQAFELYDRLLRPLEPHLSSTRLIIVADGSLHYLPFTALSDGSEYLLERYKLRSLSSASMLNFLQQRDTINMRIIALGNPELGDATLDLPGAETEVKSIKRMFPLSDVATRASATETLVKNISERYSVLHIASHGKFDSAAPLTSRLMLAADENNDGVLMVAELYDMQLPVDLVVLSACETGLGDIKNGGDVIGLTRGFLYAGANSVVSTLWVVEDKTTKSLMLNFYQNLNKYSRQDISLSLSSAQMSVFKTINPHPYYWAGFQLTGSL